MPMLSLPALSISNLLSRLFIVSSPTEPVDCYKKCSSLKLLAVASIPFSLVEEA